jgi:transposase-like protein
MPGLPPPPFWGGDKRGGCGIDSIFPNIITSTLPLIMSNLFEFCQNDKLEHLIRCPHCATTLITRNGTYLRAHPEENGQVAVQRYLCKSPQCPWKTFSVLPYPFLPIIRHFYRTIFLCHSLCYGQNKSQADTARQLNVTRGVVRRFGGFCRRFIPWFNREESFADWGPDPETNQAALWSDFTRDISHAFYPCRWLFPPPTQYIPPCFC